MASLTGELETLSQAGIASISLASTPTAINVGGNVITAEGTLTFTNGTTEAIDQVSLSASNKANLSGLNKEAISVIQQVASGVAAKAIGAANAVADSISGIEAPLLVDNTNLSNSLTVTKPIVNYQYTGLQYTQGIGTGPTTFYGTFNLVSNQINIITPTYQVYKYAYPFGASGDWWWQTNTIASYSAPQSVQNTEQTVVTALSAVKTAATQVSTAAVDQESSGNAAVLADTSSAVAGSAADTSAMTAANTAETAWQKAFANIKSASSSLQNATSALGVSQTALNSIIITNTAYAAGIAFSDYANYLPSQQIDNAPVGFIGPAYSGQEYASSQDALEATYSFRDQSSAASSRLRGSGFSATANGDSPGMERAKRRPGKCRFDDNRDRQRPDCRWCRLGNDHRQHQAEHLHYFARRQCYDL